MPTHDSATTATTSPVINHRPGSDVDQDDPLAVVATAEDRKTSAVIVVTTSQHDLQEQVNMTKSSSGVSSMSNGSGQETGKTRWADMHTIQIFLFIFLGGYRENIDRDVHNEIV